MSSRGNQPEWTRRRLLAAGGSVAGSLVLGGLARAQDKGSSESDGPYHPFKMGLQSYSLRGYAVNGRPDLPKALQVTKELGLHFWESYPAHVPMMNNSQAISFSKREIEAWGITVVGYGVVPLTKDAAATRRVFAFAKAMGLEYLSASPSPDSFDLLDRLVEESGIAVGIHNHGPGDRYAKIETIAAAIKDHHPKIGCCIDTGHFLRSREDPVHAVEAFGQRVYGVHLKDVKDAKTFTILGQGDLRTVDLLKALAKNHYRYCLAIEYEEKPEDPKDDIKACLAEARKAIAEVRKA
ncbi:MAG TPA: sugar phosphate isomerase/epimerase [Isosphaeraceae bacterium]|nr:sugar phosphate isomerase/epimerase [Isosphaeraceae bacterium]